MKLFNLLKLIAIFHREFIGKREIFQNFVDLEVILMVFFSTFFLCPNTNASGATHIKSMYKICLILIDFGFYPVLSNFSISKLKFETIN